jgi:hypothetical protein
VKAFAKTLGFILAVRAAFAVGAAPATLALGSSTLSAGNAPVTSCGVSSLSATWNVTNSNTISQVVVPNIPAACSGDTLSVTLADSSHNSLGSASTTLSGCSTTCTATFTSFGATVTSYNVYFFNFAVTGP